MFRKLWCLVDFMIFNIKILFQEGYSLRVFLVDPGIPEQAYNYQRKKLPAPPGKETIVEIELVNTSLMD